jgi:hypothetical protein
MSWEKIGSILFPLLLLVRCGNISNLTLAVEGTAVGVSSYTHTLTTSTTSTTTQTSTSTGSITGTGTGTGTGTLSVVEDATQAVLGNFLSSINTNGYTLFNVFNTDANRYFTANAATGSVTTTPIFFTDGVCTQSPYAQLSATPTQLPALYRWNDPSKAVSNQSLYELPADSSPQYVGWNSLQDGGSCVNFSQTFSTVTSEYDGFIQVQNTLYRFSPNGVNLQVSTCNTSSSYCIENSDWSSEATIATTTTLLSYLAVTSTKTNLFLSVLDNLSIEIYTCNFTTDCKLSVNWYLVKQFDEVTGNNFSLWVNVRDNLYFFYKDLFSNKVNIVSCLSTQNCTSAAGSNWSNSVLFPVQLGGNVQATFQNSQIILTYTLLGGLGNIQPVIRSCVESSDGNCLTPANWNTGSLFAQGSGIGGGAARVTDWMLFSSASTTFMAFFNQTTPGTYLSSCTGIACETSTFSTPILIDSATANVTLQSAIVSQDQIHVVRSGSDTHLVDMQCVGLTTNCLQGSGWTSLASSISFNIARLRSWSLTANGIPAIFYTYGDNTAGTRNLFYVPTNLGYPLTLYSGSIQPAYSPPLKEAFR